MQIYGVKAKAYINYSETIHHLSEIIAKRMILPEFYFKTDMDPPHELVGHCEAMGFSLWLYAATTFTGFNYVLELETNSSFSEIVNGHMHDISPWLVRYLYKIGGIESAIG